MCYCTLSLLTETNGTGGSRGNYRPVIDATGDKDVEDIYVRVVKPSKGVRELTAFELIV
ncbi:unnamed protein product [Spirodela intermedia]|uniref:Uncharacterized protein n=1 Tax=Spirodela intermedia TaxID=51605 RepID=A0A7I8KNX9_SPIIN|nr:unnamed protein product [Spirodela intermedia]